MTLNAQEKDVASLGSLVVVPITLLELCLLMDWDVHVRHLPLDVVLMERLLLQVLIMRDVDAKQLNLAAVLTTRLLPEVLTTKAVPVNPFPMDVVLID